MALAISSHSSRHCPGNCSIHPLTDSMIVRMMSGVRWGDIIYAVPKTEAEKVAEEEYIRDFEVIQASSRMRAYAQRQERVVAVTKKKKIERPCKWLYIKEDNTYSKHLTGACCWAWEYTDPKTGRRETPRTCTHIHPDEFLWRSEWN